MRTVCSYLVFLLALQGIFPLFAAAEYTQVTGVLDVRTSFSDGEMTVGELARLARSRGIDAVFFTDHDRLVMEYGLFPLRHLLRKRESRNAIHASGADAYLSAIAEAAQEYPEMVLIPGCESVPYYYWTGSYFSGNLTAHDHERRLLAVGLDRPADYEQMPVIHNGMSIRHVGSVAPQLLVFAGVFVIGLFLTREKRRLYRWAGFALCIASALFAINTKPFRSTPYDQYMGNLGAAPYQLYIDYVTSRGGLVFWNYPETRSGVRPLGPIELSTLPYPHMLEKTSGYTGFAAIYGDTITATEPGHEWDRILLDYCRGRRERPVWGVSTSDYHAESGAGGALGNFQTVLLVEEKTAAGVLTAMRAGRMYAVRGRYPQRMVLERFSVSAAGLEERGLLGEEIALASAPEIQVAVSARVRTERPVKVRLIRGGTVVSSFETTLPFSRSFVDESYPPGRKTYYRIDVRGGAGILVSNPVFVTVRPTGQAEK